MMYVAITLFLLSLLGIVILFALKAWELRTSKVVAPAMRERVDAQAFEVKKLLARLQTEIKKLPPEMVYLGRTILHDAALGAAALARFLEHQSHRVAEMVSHKRSFERRETQSEFLKNMSEYKNGSDSDLDAADENRYSA